MTGDQWEKLQKWQLESFGRRIMVEMDWRVSLFPPYGRSPQETIIASVYQDGVVSVAVRPAEIDLIDEKLSEKALEAMGRVMAGNAFLLDKPGKGGKGP